jgi:predicted dehydrogenase
MTEIRVGLIGAGVIGRTHAEVCDRLPGFALAGVVDPSDAACDFADSLNVPIFADVESLVRRGSIQAAIIATPNETHVGLAKQCLELSIPILVEKPVTNTLREAARLVEASERLDVPVLVGHHRRHSPIIRKALEILGAGVIGDLTVASAFCFLMKPDDYFSAPWRSAPGTGGPLLINLIHEVDMVRFLCGDISSVSAMSSSAIRRSPVEDTAVAIARLAQGGMASFVISDASAGPWAWDLTSGENNRFARHEAQSHFICGTKGALSIPDLAIWAWRGEKSWANAMVRHRPATPSGNPYEEQMRHFGDVVRGRARPLVSARDAAQSVAALEAIKRSAEAGREMTVECLPVPATESSRSD